MGNQWYIQFFTLSSNLALDLSISALPGRFFQISSQTFIAGECPRWKFTFALKRPYGRCRRPKRSLALYPKAWNALLSPQCGSRASVRHGLGGLHLNFSGSFLQGRQPKGRKMEPSWGQDKVKNRSYPEMCEKRKTIVKLMKFH